MLLIDTPGSHVPTGNPGVLATLTSGGLMISGSLVAFYPSCLALNSIVREKERYIGRYSAGRGLLAIA